MELWELVVGFVALFGTVIGGMRAYDFLTRNSPPAIPKQFIGRLPASRQAINSGGEQQLRSALMILTQIRAASYLLLPDTATRVERYLKEAQAKGVAQGELLSEAGALLLRIQSQDDVVSQLSIELRNELSTWLQQYLQGR